jgi:tryptophan synthase alpha chain
VSVRNSLDTAFAVAREEGRAALLPYLPAGYPSQERFLELAQVILESGADALEIGIPFSDPLLDGPAIQAAQQRALELGVTPDACLRLASETSRRIAKPLLFMGAYNPILAHGLARFSAAAAASGVAGLIVPDLPLEEQDYLRTAAGASSLHLIQLVAPTSTAERLGRICSAASGFIYGISVAGVTGARSSIVETARPLVERVRACTDVPVAVGFGISGPAAAREVASFADGIAVGSALVTLIDRTPGGEQVAAVEEFIRSLREAVEVARV